MIRTSGPGAPTPNHTFIHGLRIQGQELSGLVDSGVAVNCIRDSLARNGYNSHVSLYGPNGQPMCENARYVIETIDGTPQKLYLVPNLTEQVILGDPYFIRITPTDILHIPTTKAPRDGGRLRPLSAKELDALDEYIEDALEADLTSFSCQRKTESSDCA